MRHLKFVGTGNKFTTVPPAYGLFNGSNVDKRGNKATSRM